MGDVMTEMDKVNEALERGDYATAFKLSLPLAEQGDADARYIIGVMYANGHGVAQDYVQACMWLKLAAKNDHEDAKYDLAVTEGKLTKDQIAEAERLAAAWLAKR